MIRDLSRIFLSIELRRGLHALNNDFLKYDSQLAEGKMLII